MRKYVSIAIIAIFLIGAWVYLKIPHGSAYPSAYIGPKEKATYLIMRQIADSNEKYWKECGKYPARLEDLTKKYIGCGDSGSSKYLDSVPVDVWGDSFLYEDHGASYVLKSKNIREPKAAPAEYWHGVHDGPGGYDGN